MPLRAAGFVLALYNPVSQARPWQLGAAFDRLRAILEPSTPGRLWPRRRAR